MLRREVLGLLAAAPAALLADKEKPTAETIGHLPDEALLFFIEVIHPLVWDCAARAAQALAAALERPMALPAVPQVLRIGNTVSADGIVTEHLHPYMDGHHVSLTSLVYPEVGLRVDDKALRLAEVVLHRAKGRAPVFNSLPVASGFPEDGSWCQGYDFTHPVWLRTTMSPDRSTKGWWYLTMDVHFRFNAWRWSNL